MQTLYSIESMNNETNIGEPLKILKNNLEQSRKLFIYLIYFITEVARYAEADASQKAHKHLPTESDLNVNTKIAGNELIWNILEDASFKNALNEYKVIHLADKDLLKRTYLELIQSTEYKIIFPYLREIKNLKGKFWNLFSTI